MTKFRRVLSDGAVRDEVTQLRSLRKLRFCLNHSSSGPMVLFDAGAAVYVVMSCLTPYFTSAYPSLTCAAATADGNSLSVSGRGELGPLSNVLIFDTIRHNCISVSQLSDIGITVSFTPTGVAVANGVTSVYGRCEGGLYKLSQNDLLSLSSVSVCNIGARMLTILICGIGVWPIHCIVRCVRQCAIS